MSDRIYLTKEEQYFLIEWLEIENVSVAVDKFATILAEERADPGKLQEYIKKIIQRMK